MNNNTIGLIFYILLILPIVLGATYPFLRLRPGEKLIQGTFNLVGLITTALIVAYVFLQKEPVVVEVFDGFNLQIDMRNTLVYLASTTLLAITGIFSFQYIHKEISFHKFYINLSIFWLGLFVFIFSMNDIATFAGWELIGISSIFLISYYHYRKSPIISSLYVVNFYKVADIILLSSLLFLSHRSILSLHVDYKYYLYLGIILAGLIKSASFPFTSWLPKAMEGPTPSSAIFYAALSVNTGVLLIIKFYPSISNVNGLTTVILVMGVLTAAYSSMLSRVQSDIKSNLVYSASSQIGLVLIEISLGYTDLALFHLFSNSFFKTYQFIRTPSLFHLYHSMEGEYGKVFEKNGVFFQYLIPKSLRKKIYYMAMNHFYLDLLFSIPPYFIKKLSKLIKITLYPLIVPNESSSYKSLMWWLYYCFVAVLVSFEVVAIDSKYFDIIPWAILLISIVMVYEKNLHSFIALFSIYKILESFIIHGVHTHEPMKYLGMIVVGLLLFFILRTRNYIQNLERRVLLKSILIFLMLFFTNFPLLLQSLVNEHIIDAFIVKDKISDLLVYAIGNTLFNLGLYNFIFNHVYTTEAIDG